MLRKLPRCRPAAHRPPPNRAPFKRFVLERSVTVIAPRSTFRMPQFTQRRNLATLTYPDKFWTNRLKLLVQKEQLSEARRWYNLIPPEIRSTKHATLLLRLMPIEEAEQFTAQLTNSGVQLPITFYNILMNKYCNAGDYSKALEVFEKARQTGITVTEATLNILAKTYIKLKDLDKAKELLNEAVDATVYSTVISGYAEIGASDQVRALLNEMQDKGLSIHPTTYTKIVRSYADNGHIELAEQALEEAKQAGKLSADAFLPLVNYHASRGGINRANAVLEAMKREGFQPDERFYLPILAKQSSLGEHKAVHTLVDSMKRAGLSTVSTLTTMLQSYISNNHKSKVIEVMQEIMARGMIPDETRWSSLIRYLGARREIELARKAFDYIYKLVSLDILTFNSILRLYANENDRVNFEQIIALMEKDKVRPNQFTYHCKLAIAARSGDVDEVARVLDEMKAAGYKDDEFTRLVMIRSSTEMGDYEAAEKNLNDAIRNGYATPAMVNAIIKAYCQVEDIEKVNEWMAEAARLNFSLDLNAYYELMSMYVRLGDQKRAFELLESVRQERNQLPSWFYDMLITLFGNSREPEQAERIRELMLSHGVQPTKFTYLALMQAHAVVGDYARSFELLEEMRNLRIYMMDVPYSIVFSALKRSIDERVELVHARHVFNRIKYVAKKTLGPKKNVASESQSASSSSGSNAPLPEAEAYHIAELANDNAPKSQQVVTEEEKSLLREKTLQRFKKSSGNSSAAKAILEKAISEGVAITEELFHPLLINFGHARKLDELDNIVQLARSYLGRFSESFYSALIQAYGRCGEHSRIPQILDMMKKDDVASAKFYSEALHFYAMADDIQNAEAMLEEMRKRGWTPDVCAYRELVEAYSRLKMTDKLKEIMEDFMKNVKKPVLDDLSTIHLIIGKCLRYMREDHVDPTMAVKFPLLFVFTHIGLEAESEALYHELLNEGARVPYVFNQMLVMYSRSRNHEKLQAVLDDMEKLQVSKNTNTYVTLAAYYALRAPSPDEQVQTEVVEEQTEEMAKKP